MRPSESEKAFRRYCGTSGVSLDALSADAAVRGMLGFYRDVRAEQVGLEDNGDMVLYQWGTYGFSRPRTFQFDLTRQFIVEQSQDDEGISQLHFTLHYLRSSELEKLKGNEWCRTPADVAEFDAFIRGSEAFRAVQPSCPTEVELYWEQV
jgi:hypothetical protein